MSVRFHARRRIEWHDTDAAGIAHFSSFFRLMEETEHEFLRSRGLSVLYEDGARKLSWPRVSVRCDFAGAVRFEDMVDIELVLVRLGAKSVTYEFHFTHEGRPIAVGSITAVCCEFDAHHVPRAVEIPQQIAGRLSQSDPIT